MAVALEIRNAIPAPEDDVLLDEAFAQYEQAAEANANVQTPEQMLEEFIPATSSAASTYGSAGTSDGRGRSASERTAPTSMDIHNGAAADVSEVATGGSADNDVVYWGIGSNFGEATFRKARRMGTKAAGPTSPPTTLWHGIAVYLALAFSLVLIMFCTSSLIWGISFPLSVVLNSAYQESPSFRATYFPTLTQIPEWHRTILVANGLAWLTSVIFCIRLFRRMLHEPVSNRTAQSSLLCHMILWLACSSVDGLIRLRTREEISMSMIGLLVMISVLSHFANCLAAPDIPPAPVQRRETEILQH